MYMQMLNQIRGENLSAISRQSYEDSLAVRWNHQRENYASDTRHDAAMVNTLSEYATRKMGFIDLCNYLYLCALCDPK